MKKAIKEQGLMLLLASAFGFVGIVYARPGFLLTASIILGGFIYLAIKNKADGEK